MVAKVLPILLRTLLFSCYGVAGWLQMIYNVKYNDK